MGRIYVTGDIHAEPDRFNTENFPEQKELTHDDYMIICGDLDWYGQRIRKANGRSSCSTGWRKDHIPHCSWTGTMVRHVVN